VKEERAGEWKRGEALLADPINLVWCPYENHPCSVSIGTDFSFLFLKFLLKALLAVNTGTYNTCDK